MLKTKLNWQKIYLDHSPKLLGICRRYVPDIFAAEDIIHDSFITAIQKNGQLKNEKALFSWLKTIVVNNALQYLRKQSKETHLNTETSEIHDNYAEMEQNFLEEKHILAYDFTREELLASIDQLSSHHKSVFNLYFTENYSHSEISKALEIPVNTSKSHLMRAKKSVQNYLTTHFANKETSKNKTAQLLIFFGFSGLLWAQTFQNKFSDFTISPSKGFEIPSDINLNQISFSSADNFWKQKAVIGTTFFVIIIGSVLFFSPKNSFQKAFNFNDSKSEAEEKNIVLNDDLKNMKVKTQSNNDQKKIQISQQMISENNDDLKPESELIPVKSVVSSNTKIKKDSAETASHKVIVVKKIIQRDTVFIER
ncbi:RNA polymerase sigma factor [Chryseobacterium caseinilyticum]|uniref:Sigma-70 family RNA polymerase sigma factor n=1 Tax=Chryseobacterium caseinilyticum TaxID=2771428 RepID=A0ABR8ZA23_9FLAO|nr:sigma-70 family RNA polymerase sigma factor [Chryseobacterium caseinilyticum]MBD8082081.1 sigma-70 family RNA polymerase sigma factor [Chryseobacterium caseinilyticum]